VASRCYPHAKLDYTVKIIIFLESFKSGAALVGKVPWSSLSGKTHERNSDIGIIGGQGDVCMCSLHVGV
jgi:hypothetical protein